jgi:capsular exopolysaccharide synthesis family protein
MENQSNQLTPDLKKNGNGNGNGNGKAPLLVEFSPASAAPSIEETSQPTQILDILRRRAALILGMVITSTAAAWALSLTQTELYAGQFQLLVEAVNAQTKQDREPLSNSSAAAGGSKQDGLDYETQIQVLLSPKTMQPIVEQIQKKYPDVTYQSLQTSLKVERPDETKLIQVSLVDPNPDRVKFILDQIAGGYLKYSQKERENNLGTGIAFVNRQIDETRRRVDTLQRQLQAFRQQNNLIAPDTLGNQIGAQVQVLNQQKLEMQRQLAEAQQQYSGLQGRSGAVAALAADPAYQKALDKLREIESKIATESTRFEDDNAEITALRQQRDSLLPVLQQEARRVLGNRLAQVGTELSVLSTRQQVLNQTEAFLNQEIQRLPVVSRVFTDLDRERNVATESLNRLLQTRESLQVAAAQKEVPWQLITPPERPGGPSNSPARNILMGVIAGLFLGIGAALLAERLDGRIRTVSELKKQTKLPTLGVVPDASWLDRENMMQVLEKVNNSQNRFDNSNYSTFLEAFRKLYTNLCLLNIDKPIKSIVVSSGGIADGKTTVSMYLAQAAAAMGQRVLLVEGDLRHPEVSSSLGISNQVGLSDLIVRSLNPQDVIQRLSVLVPAGSVEAGRATESNHLSVLTAGSIAIDPTRFLSSQKMQRLTEYFRAIYDLVIFDAPPLTHFADSSLLARHTDGMVLVASLGKTEQAELQQTLESLKTARISVLGVVANRGDNTPVDY